LAIDAMLGLVRGVVALSPHNEEWHRLFKEERSHILNSVGEHLLAVEHVGSTAICGISAKPIIDIAAAIARFEDGAKCVERLERLGYEYKGENGVPGRHYFSKGSPRTHHLHMVTMESVFWREHLIFRDHLKENPSVARAYDRLKQDLAARFPADRDAYTNGKEAFIRDLLQKAVNEEQG
jgi:GrpB-like predicted nucleotidyltransferase (UPF0157 family)